MVILGIIVEYNPFHNGHLHHLNTAKRITKADFTVAIMSGNFLQRGLPACLDKHTRTELALKYGVDIVIELPVLYAVSAANYFAKGAVALLNAIGADYLVFGAETEELSILENLANIGQDEDFVSELHKNLNQGFSYSHAQRLALRAITPPNCLSENRLSPNNILGIEYLRALKQTNSQIKPLIINRDQSYTSATEINKIILAGGTVENSVPEATLNALRSTHTTTLDNYSQIFHYKLLSENKNLSEFLDITEGIENRIIKKSKEHFLLTDILDAVKTKRYTQAKLQRIAAHILLDIKKTDMASWPTPPYMRVLGFKKTAAKLLGKAGLPLVTNVHKAPHHPLLQKDIMAEDIYYLGAVLYNKRSLTGSYACEVKRCRPTKPQFPIILK